MSQASNGILGILAAGMTLGAIQFASGNDLSSAAHDRKDVNQDIQSKIGESPSLVNRRVKADRFAMSTRSTGQDKTLSFRVNQMPDTLILIRVPAFPTIDPIKVMSSTQELNTTARKSTLACEPVVSILTDVAKVLEPGRCVT